MLAKNTKFGGVSVSFALTNAMEDVEQLLALLSAALGSCVCGKVTFKNTIGQRLKLHYSQLSTTIITITKRNIKQQKTTQKVPDGSDRRSTRDAAKKRS